MTAESWVCLVTGASRGVGKGVAAVLGGCGATVYVTGRSSGTPSSPVGGTVEETAALVDERGGRGIAVCCDHTDDEQVRALFERIREEHGRLDVLVNNVWAGYAGWHERRVAEMVAPFWDKPLEFYDATMTGGVRAHFVATALAVPLLQPGSLAVTISFYAAAYPRAVDDVAYAMAKAADDRLMLMAAEALRSRGVCCVSLWPGLVATELIREYADFFDLREAESPELSGRVVAALARDPGRMALSGLAAPVAELADHYGITDVDDRRPASQRASFARDALRPPGWPPPKRRPN